MLGGWLTWTLIAAGWLAFAGIANAAARAHPARPGIGIGIQVVRWYARTRHRLRVKGAEHVPTPEAIGTRGLIVTANHEAGIDPLLVQAAMPDGGHFIRWVMGRDMREPALDAFWLLAEIIPVDRTGKADVGALREMLEHLHEGGVLGLFPEGRIRKPGQPLGEFQGGLGLLVSRSGALVLPAVIRGVPRAPKAWDSLLMRSASSVEFKPVIDYRAAGMKAGAIAADLHARYAQWQA